MSAKLVFLSAHGLLLTIDDDGVRRSCGCGGEGAIELNGMCKLVESGELVDFVEEEEDDDDDDDDEEDDDEDEIDDLKAK